MSFRPFMLRIAVLCCIFPAAMLHAQADSAPAVLPNVQVKEWLIIAADPYRPRASPGSLVGSSLPDFISDLRPKVAPAKQNEPSPIGLIRFYGQTDQKITVRLTTRVGGIFYGCWPDGRIRPAELLWRDITLDSPRRQIVPLLASQWINGLRSGNSAMITSSDHSEKFLLYDVEFPYSLPLKLSDGKLVDQPVAVANIGTTPLHDLVLYRPDPQHGGWSSGSVDEVASGLAHEGRLAGQPAPLESPPVRLTQTDTADPSQFLMNDWKSRLASFGLDACDLDLIVRTLKAQALDDRALTAVFRMDDADLDRLLPIEITPRPAKITRVALVIARNVDPVLPDLIDQLISQLGDPAWKKREAASDLLASYGPAAEARLKVAAQTSRDQEIVLRAERLLRFGAAR